MPAAGQHAEHRSERGAAQHRRDDAPEILAREPELADRASTITVAGLLVLEVAQDFRDAEHAHRDRDEIDAGE